MHFRNAEKTLNSYRQFPLVQVKIQIKLNVIVPLLQQVWWMHRERGLISETIPRLLLMLQEFAISAAEVGKEW